ncbi:LacI family DNA-binding transcriptional regulator [Pseudactinotalea suaedae]|uniref:LacI family DNA-binding transcriptional regulator n=1 Tax=Pseudactinotalea suaedae TaxID=1524924 RepID=UPI0012E2DB11|nr:LacI family DNA-binding transcriptional regulator [Pseudactinotalea suaedae]
MRIDDPGDAAVPARRRPAPTSKDVARVAGVSQSTVSYVMSGKRPISEATRRLVLDAIAELTYEPHAGARALAGHRTKVVGLMMPLHDAESAGGLMEFAEEIAIQARRRDHDVLMLTADEGPSALARVQRRAMCDAVVIMQVITDDPRVATAREVDLPVILIGVPADRDGLHCIDVDFESAAELLVDELADASAREIAVLGWAQEWDDAGANFIPRFRASAAARAAARGVALRWVGAPHTRGGVEAFLDAVLDPDGGAHPGLLTVQSPHHVGAALQQRGLLPGRDLDLVSLCTDAEAERQPVPLTAVSTQPRCVSAEAMAWLFDLLDGDAPAELRLVPARLTRRASVRPIKENRP